MNIEKKTLFSKICLATFAACLLAYPLKADTLEEPILVGHISHIEGKLFRYGPLDETTESDWVLVPKDAPWGPTDILSSEKLSRAEFIFPNSTLVRIDGSTQIEAVAIADDMTALYMSAGTGRFYSRSSGETPTSLRVETAFGYVIAPPETTFDLHVSEDSLELTVLWGTAGFVHGVNGQEEKYEVDAKSFSLAVDSQYVTTRAWDVRELWDDWNRRRDALWAQRERIRIEYLPPDLDRYAYALDRHGRWEQVYYDGTHRFRWRPRVGIDWSPFRNGRWTARFGTHVWLPFEPFGYVTHHYGQWSHIRGLWYWTPPAHRRYPRRVARAHWHPGRVGWIHSGNHIGWFPLGPRETYYGHRQWGPHTRKASRKRIHRQAKHAYYKHAIIRKKKDFRRNQDAGHRPFKDRRRIIRHARSTPDSDRVLARHKKQRHRPNRLDHTRNPDPTRAARIRHQKARARIGTALKSPELKQKIKRARKRVQGKEKTKRLVRMNRKAIIQNNDKIDRKLETGNRPKTKLSAKNSRKRIDRFVAGKIDRSEKTRIRKGKQRDPRVGTNAARRGASKVGKAPRQISRPPYTGKGQKETAERNQERGRFRKQSGKKEKEIIAREKPKRRSKRPASRPEYDEESKEKPAYSGKGNRHRPRDTSRGQLRAKHRSKAKTYRK